MLNILYFLDQFRSRKLFYTNKWVSVAELVGEIELRPHSKNPMGTRADSGTNDYDLRREIALSMTDTLIEK